MCTIKTKWILLAALLFAKPLCAQTFHFSQFNAAPMALNPALTGNMEADFRLTGNFRSQWVNAGTPYLTGALGADFRLMKNSIAEGNTLGLGFTIVNDQSNGGGLQNTSIGVSSAFHIKLDEDGYKTLGLGFQGTYQERKINLAKLYFEDQFTSEGFINTLPSATNFTDLNKTYFNTNVGLLFDNDNPMSGFRWYAGASASNLLKTDLSISPDQVYQLPLKLTAHAGSAIALNDWTYLDLSAIYMQMGQTKNIIIGGAFDYGLDDESAKSLLLGSWYRLGDAVIPYVGFRNNGLQLGISYDVTTSSLKTMSQTRNAFECSIIFNPSTADAKRPSPNWY